MACVGLGPCHARVALCLCRAGGGSKFGNSGFRRASVCGMHGAPASQRLCLGSRFASPDRAVPKRFKRLRPGRSDLSYLSCCCVPASRSSARVDSMAVLFPSILDVVVPPVSPQRYLRPWLIGSSASGAVLLLTCSLDPADLRRRDDREPTGHFRLSRMDSRPEQSRRGGHRGRHRGLHARAMALRDRRRRSAPHQRRRDLFGVDHGRVLSILVRCISLPLSLTMQGVRRVRRASDDDSTDTAAWPALSARQPSPSLHCAAGAC